MEEHRWDMPGEFRLAVYWEKLRASWTLERRKLLMRVVTSDVVQAYAGVSWEVGDGLLAAHWGVKTMCLL